MTNPTAHFGGCHCGKVRFEARTDLTDVIACNCSICGKKGLWLTFVPKEGFTLLSGDAFLKDYRFGKKRIHHLFCSECGVESFGRGISPDGQETYAVNVRCLDAVDLDTLTPKPFDGRSL